MSSQVQERIAAIGLAGPPVSVASTWIAQATDIMQLVVLVVGAVSGAASAWYYIRRGRQIKSGDE